MSGIKDKVKNADTIPCQAVAYFEAKKMFIALRGGRCFVGQLKQEFDVETGLTRSFYAWTLPQEVAKMNKHLTVLEGKKMVEMFDKWFKSPNATRYESVQFIPYKDKQPKLPDGTLNLYTGYAVKPVDHKIKYLRLKHLLIHFTGGVDAHLDWLLDWIAFNFQYPQKKIGVAVVLRGTEGTGKGLLGRLFLLIHGMHAAALTNPDHVVGRFNAHLETLVFAVLTEAFFAGDAKTNGALKALLTDKELMLERKFQDAEPSKNYLNCLMTTNEDFAVPASATSRRYAVFDANKVEDLTHIVSNDFCLTLKGKDGESVILHFKEGMGFDYEKWEGHEQLQTAEPNLVIVKNFYKELAEEIESEQILEQFLFDSLTRDITNFIPNANIPKTTALIEQRQHQLKQDSIACWFYNLLVEKGSNFVIQEFNEGTGKYTTFEAYLGIPSAVLYKNYTDWCKDMKQSHFKIEHKAVFTQRLKKITKQVGDCWVSGDRGVKFWGDIYAEVSNSLGID